MNGVLSSESVRAFFFQNFNILILISINSYARSPIYFLSATEAEAMNYKCVWYTFREED